MAPPQSTAQSIGLGSIKCSSSSPWKHFKKRATMASQLPGGLPGSEAMVNLKDFKAIEFEANSTRAPRRRREYGQCQSSSSRSPAKFKAQAISMGTDRNDTADNDR